MFKEPSQYFFNIYFKWTDALDVFGVGDHEREGFKVSDAFRFDSPNGYGNDVGLNEEMALFEYYVIPEALKNAGFKPDSTIYDCQYKRFFSTINLIYRNVLVNDKAGIKISCSFERFVKKDTSMFTVTLTDSSFDTKHFTIVFPSECLNRVTAGKDWGGVKNIRTFKYFDIEGEDNVAQEISVPESISLSILLQSEHDASAGPRVHNRVQEALLRRTN